MVFHFNMLQFESVSYVLDLLGMNQGHRILMKTLEQTQVLSEGDKALLHTVKQAIQKLLPTATILLYGSKARGTAEPESDYDILVLTDEFLSTPSVDRIRDAVFDLEMESGKVISIQFFTKSDYSLHGAMPFIREVDRDGIIL